MPAERAEWRRPRERDLTLTEEKSELCESWNGNGNGRPNFETNIPNIPTAI